MSSLVRLVGTVWRQVTFSVGVTPAAVWITPFLDGDKKFGTMMDIEVVHALQNASLWPAGGTTSIATSE